MGATLVCVGLALGVLLVGTARGRADDRRDDDSRVRIGFAIAPVPLNAHGLNPALVGLGSYLVNTEGCNDCHSAGPRTEYAPGGNPYFGLPKKVNPATYLGGGRDFGELPNPPIGSAHIISRNLMPTPETGLPGGDITYEKFLDIIRHGKDLDGIHPTCTGAPNTGGIPQAFRRGPDYAVAEFQRFDGPRDPRDLRISKSCSLHPGKLSRAGWSGHNHSARTCGPLQRVGFRAEENQYLGWKACLL